MTTAAVGIGAVRCLLPETRLRVAELAELASLPSAAATFAQTCGIETVAVFDGATAAGLAAAACRDLLAGAPAAPDVLVLVAPRAPEVLLGSDACRVQHEAGLPGAFAFTLDGLGCAGSSAAWAVAGDLLRANPRYRTAMVAHASRPAGLDRVRHPVTVVGDGAFAMTLVRGGRPVLRAHRMETDGVFHDLFTVDYRSAPWYEWREVCGSPDRYRFELAMRSRVRLRRLVDEVLAEADVGERDIRATVMQNVTASAYEFYETVLGLPIHPVCRTNLAAYGHLGAMDVVLNVDRLLSSAELTSGDLLLVLNNSPVAAFTVTLWEV